LKNYYVYAFILVFVTRIVCFGSENRGFNVLTKTMQILKIAKKVPYLQHFLHRVLYLLALLSLKPLIDFIYTWKTVKSMLNIIY
jgi:hypothetical protein